MSSICGGVISKSQWYKDMKKYGVWADAMCYVMPDKQYKKYYHLVKQGKVKESHKLFVKYAYSTIG